jgi:hypothetical protein
LFAKSKYFSLANTYIGYGKIGRQGSQLLIDAHIRTIVGANV